MASECYAHVFCVGSPLGVKGAHCSYAADLLEVPTSPSSYLRINNKNKKNLHRIILN